MPNSAFKFSSDYHLTGNGWYPRTLAATPQLDYADITRPDGFGYHFTSSDGGQNWSADADVNAKLVAVQGSDGAITQWRLTDENSDVSVYRADGQFVEMLFFRGGGYALTYSDASTPAGTAPQAGLLINVTDHEGHALAFQYDARSRMVRMQDAAANAYSYAYDAEGNLTSVTYPDTRTRQYHYDEPQYSANAGVAVFRGLLTGISDEISPGNVQRFATYRYSARNPVSTEHAGGVEKYTFDYSQGTVTEPLGNVLTVNASRVLGRLVITDRNQLNATGTDKDRITTNYDAAGNISSYLGFDRTMTCYQYETPRNLETVRIEGAGSQDNCTALFQATTLVAPRRRTTTAWHPALRLPVAIAQPLSLEEMVYDVAGNLLTKTVSATSDANGVQGRAAQKVGVSRVYAFTWNTSGKMLTAKGPRTDVNDTTSYSYDAAGNLLTVMNPLGQVTTYANYDANGRPGRIIEANGVATAITYSPRGWVTSRTVTSAGLTTVTSYEYDGVGQLVKLTLPDNSYLSYTYDAAQRLTDLADSAGNSVHYTLDNAGNRIKEETVGAGGTLARQTARVFNTLGQLKQVTGGAQ